MSNNSIRKCVILARGGSKRIANKNLQLIHGKSLVEHAIDCCLENDIDTILSSDSEQILKIGEKRNIKLHKRSVENSDDSASSESALLEILRYFNLANEIEIILVPPTNPMRTSLDLANFIDIWEKSAKPFGFDQGFSVFPMKNDFWYEKNKKFFRVRDIIFNQIEPRVSKVRSKIFLETSALYICKAELIYNGVSLVGSNPYPIELSRNSSFDIDNQSDLDFVRKILE